MELLLILIHGLILSFAIVRLPYFKESLLSSKVLLSAFWIKVFAGWLYGYLHLFYYNGGDTWSFIANGQVIFNSFFDHPSYFFELIFGPINRPIPDYLFVYIDTIAGWTDWRYYSVLRVDAVIHIVAGNYYSTHVLFWAFLSFIGVIGLYRVFIHYFPTKESVIAIALFCTPSIVFWTSGIHKDGLTFLCTGLLIYHFHQSLQKKFNLQRTVIIFCTAIYLVMLRPYVIGLLVPAILSWYWCFHRPQKILLKYLTVYLLAIIATQVISSYSPFNILTKIVDTRQHFVEESIGEADIEIDALDPTIWSLVRHAPNAFFNTCCRPHLGDVNSLRRALSMLETWCILLLIILAFISHTKITDQQQLALFYAALFFSGSFYVFVGLIVDNLGAIVRYRTNALPFLLLSIIALMDVEKLKQWLKK